jgi:hypothetical protein
MIKEKKSKLYSLQKLIRTFPSQNQNLITKNFMKQKKKLYKRNEAETDSVIIPLNLDFVERSRISHGTN